MTVKATLLAGAVLVAVSALAPSAAADPHQFPDLSDYASVNAADYTTYHAYLTAGAQFATPSGHRCRMSFTHKQNGAYMQCWGALPGTSNNHVGLSYVGGPFSSAATFSNVDLAQMDFVPAGPGVPATTLSPQDYKLLPAHSKLSYTDGPMQTCGVDTSMTACELTVEGQRHGFVLSPDGSWAF